MIDSQAKDRSVISVNVTPDVHHTERTCLSSASFTRNGSWLSTTGLLAALTIVGCSGHTAPSVQNDQQVNVSEKVEQPEIDRETLEILAPLVKAIKEKQIVVREGGILEVPRIETSSTLVGKPESLATAIVPNGIALVNNGQIRVHLGQDRRDYDGDGKMDIGIAELVFYSPKLDPVTGKALLDKSGNPIMKNALEFEDHVTWRGFKIFDLGKVDRPNDNSPVFEAIFVDAGQPVPANMPYLSEGKLNIITRNKSHPIRLVMQDSSDPAKGDSNVIELIVDGSKNRVIIDGQEFPLKANIVKDYSGK